MEKQPNLNEHYQNLEAHIQTSGKLDQAQTNYDLAAGLHTEATPEEEKAAEEMLTEARQELERIRSEYDAVTAKGKEVGDTEKNLELWVEAYEDHYERLLSDARELRQKIDNFKSTLQADKLFTQAKKHELPAYITEEVGDEVGQKRVRYIFMEILGTEIAKTEGANNFSDQDIETFWQRAVKRYQMEPKKATPVKASAGWTPWHKGRVE